MGAENSYAVNRMAQDLFSDPVAMDLFHTNRAALYDRYDLSKAQRDAVDSGDREALASVGVHPILMMHLFTAGDPSVADHISVKAYLPTEASSHG